MKVLVTGASGFVGSHAAAALLDHGAQVRALARRAERVEAAMRPFGAETDLEVAIGDMTDRAAVGRAVDGCDAIVHTAAVGLPGGAGGVDYESNVTGAHAILDAAKQARVRRIVYTSSLAAYLPSPLEVLGPDAPLAQPTTPYSRSKHVVEQLIRERAAAGAPVTTFVLGGVYGPPSPHPEQSFTAILGALQSGMMVVPPWGNPVIDVRDAAQLIAAAVSSSSEGPHHLMAGGTFVTWAEWVALLREVSGQDVVGIEISADDLVAMGRQEDEVRAAGGVPSSALSVEAATIMASGRPTDDSATLDLLGVSYRPLVETFADTVSYLRELGLLST